MKGLGASSSTKREDIRLKMGRFEYSTRNSKLNSLIQKNDPHIKKGRVNDADGLRTKIIGSDRSHIDGPKKVAEKSDTSIMVMTTVMVQLMMVNIRSELKKKNWYVFVLLSNLYLPLNSF